MACPFAFMSRGSSSPSMPLVEPVSAESLSAALREGTAASHKAVERSEGVRRLMALPSASASSSGLGGGSMSREDYIRWQVALLCVYSALETALDAHLSSPLFTSSGFALLLPTLYRASTLRSDIIAHLGVLAPGTSGSSATNDQLSDVTEALAAEPCSAHDELFQLLLPQTSDGKAATSVQREHIAILDPLLASATLGYVRRLVMLGAGATGLGGSVTGGDSRPSTPGSTESDFSLASSSSRAASLLHDANADENTSLMGLFVHAYVRYLGDLSGGQHIVRRARRLWAVECEGQPSREMGFTFYDFDEAERHFAAVAPSSSPSKGLKDAFRTALDLSGEISSSSSPSSSMSSHHASPSRFHAEVVEANAAFLANAALFDALAGVEPGSHLVGDAIGDEATTTAADVAKALRQRSSGKAFKSKGGLTSIPRDSNYAHLRATATPFWASSRALASGILAKARIATRSFSLASSAQPSVQSGAKEYKTNLVLVELPWHPHVVATACVGGATVALGLGLVTRFVVA